jgi:hypothetical protein
VRRDTLFIATVGFLILPNVIFAFGWLKLGLALVVVAVAVTCVRDIWRRSKTDAPRLSAWACCFVLALAAFWTCAGGIGELNAQTSDYIKHNLVFHDLIVENWPVVYARADLGDPLLCYYLAYYLPPSLLGKVFGLQHAAAFSLAWGLLGVTLAFAWVCRLGRPRGPVVLALFTLVDGFCWLPGLYPLAQKLGLLPGAANGEWWHSNYFVERFWSFGGPYTKLQFQCEPSLLVWTPQHALGAWLGTACVLHCVLERQPPRHVLLVNAAVFLWSPFVGVGLLPFTAAACLRQPRQMWSGPNVVGGLALAAPVGLYFQAHLPQQYSGLLFSTFSGVTDGLKYLLFLVLAVGIFWAALRLIHRRYGVPSQTQWQLFSLACAVLVTVTLVYVGRHNDWVMRASMPASFVFHLTLAASAVALWQRPAHRAAALAFALLLLISAERSLKLYVLAPLGRLSEQGITTTIATARREVRGLAYLPATPGYDYAGQYLGRRDSIFGEILMRSRQDLRAAE